MGLASPAHSGQPAKSLTPYDAQARDLGQSLSLKETQFGLLWTEERVNLPICPLGLLFIHLVPLIKSLPCAGCSAVAQSRESESVPTTTDLRLRASAGEKLKWPRQNPANF